MTLPSLLTPPCAYWSARPLASASIVCAISLSTTEMTCQATTVRTIPAPTALRARIARARRKAVARKSLPSAVTNHVSGPAHGVEKRRVEIAVDLGAQARYMHVDHVGLRIEMVVPDMLEQHGAGDDLPGVLHQIFQQAELARLEDDLLAATGHLVRQPVEGQIADLEHGLLRRALRAPPRQSLDAGEQFRKCVGFGKIIVAAGAKPLHAVVDLAERGEDQDGSLVLLVAQGADQRQSIHFRQHPVDDRDVIAALRRHVVSGDAVDGVIDHMAGLAERFDQVGRRVAVVFNDKNAHDSYIASPSASAKGMAAGPRGA